MGTIIQWVSQIIIFILLATIVDLLIPATVMRKYIKLVIGLILLLIFLKPIFHIFNMNIEDAIETTFSSAYKQSESGDSVENLIKMQKRDIQASQDAYILEQMASQLKEIAKDPLHEQFQLEISHIEFYFDEDISYDNLKEVIVYVQEPTSGEGAVSKIEEVIIDTKSPVKKQEINDKEIVTLLTQLWEMDNKILTITWEGGTS